MADEFDAAAAVDSYLARPAPETTLRASLEDAVGKNPDQAADWRRAAATIGVPVDTAQALPDWSKRQKALADIDTASLANLNPVTTAFLSQSENAAIAHDDTANMGLIETLANSFRRGVPGLQQGLAATALRSNVNSLEQFDAIAARIDAGEKPASILAADDPMGVAYMTPEQRAKFRASITTPIGGNISTVVQTQKERQAIPAPDVVNQVMQAKTFGEAFSAFMGDPVKFIASIGPESMVSNAPGLVAAIPAGIAGGPVGAATVLGTGSFVSDFGNSLVDALGKAGVDVQSEEQLRAAVANKDLMADVARQAFAHAAVVGSVDALSGKVASTLTLPKSIATKMAAKPVARELANIAAQVPVQGALGAAGEAGGELAAGQNLDPGNILAEFVGEAFTAPAEVASVATGKIRERMAEGRAAEAAAARAEELIKVAEASKLRERDPDTFKAFVEQVSQDGQTPTELYINAETLANTLNQSGVTMAELQALAPSVAEQMQAENYVPGADLRIPVSELLAAPPDISKTLIDHLRDGPDAMSRAEAGEFLAARGEAIKAEVEQELGRADKRAAFQQQVDQLRDQFQAQLEATGKFRTEVNKAYATLLGNFYAVQAQRAGMSPEEMRQRYQLGVSSQDAQGRLRMEQGNPHGDALAARLAHDMEGAIAEYSALPGTDGGRILNTDEARELSPGYREDRTRSAHVHEQSSQFVKDLYARKLAQPTPAGRQPMVLFTAGGTGAGKSTSLASGHGAVLAQSAEIIYDTNMNSLGSADQKIRQALAAGRDVAIAYTYRDPVDALVNGALPRAMRMGRTVPLNEHARTHVGAYQTIKALREKYAGDPRVNFVVVDNSHGKDKSRPADFDSLAPISDNGLNESLYASLQAEHAAGRISDQVFAGTGGSVQGSGRQSGDLPAVHEAAGPGTGREPEPQRGGRAGQLNQGARGALSFGEDITTSPSVIALLEGADLSTFIHESGHFFLEVQSDLAARIAGKIHDGDTVTPGEQQIVADMDALLQSFGITGTPDQSALATWQSMSLEEKREHHETFARSFERYAMEGKAPSLELQGVFQRFRSWLISVYKTLTGLNVNLSDDVRAVIGRMLATDEAIQQAQDARNMGPLFQTPEQAGMTPEEFAAYQDLGARATESADAELDTRLLKDMKWLSGAKDKALKARQKEVAAIRNEIRAEVTREVMAQPVYRAWQFLTSKTHEADRLDGTKPAGRSKSLNPEVDNLFDDDQARGIERFSISHDYAGENDVPVMPIADADLFNGKLNTADLKARYGDAEDAPWRALSDRRMTSPKGLAIDVVAETFGYESGDALVTDLTTAQTPKNVIDAQTDQRMLERHGDITSAAALERAAEEAIHNQVRARVIATELKALTKATTVRESSDSLYTPGTVDVMAKAAREFAEQVVARLQLQNIRPKQYAAAEARSAKLAQQALGKNLPEAAMHKRNQLVNNYAAKAAYEAQAEVTAANEFFKKVIGRDIKKIGERRDVGTVQAARAILAEYGIGSKGEPAQKYLDTMAQDDPSMHAVLKDKVDTLTANAKPVKEMTVEEFRGLVEEIKGLWHQARRARQVEIDGQMLEIEAVKGDIVGRLHEIGIPDRVAGEGRAVTDGERRLAKLRTLGAALRRVESWVSLKDGANTMGPFRKFIWQPVREAADRYRADKGKYIKRYKELLSALTLGEQRIDAPELGYTFGFSRGGSGKAEILHAILHTGNESNKRKLLLGRGWATENEVTGELDTRKWDGFVNRMIDQGVLTKADFDFAQGVWDLLEDTKALAQKAHRDVFGRYFDEVSADSFTNKLGTYRGGYVPAMTDAEVVKDAATRSLQEDENQTLAYAFPSTAKGFTKGRVEYNKPLLLDLRTLSSHIDKVLLFSHMEQPIRDVRKILGSRDVSEPLHRVDPQAFDALLTPWLNRAARQTVETKVPGDNGLLRFFSKARQRAGLAAMFANVSNTAQQITGFSIAAVKVRPKYLLDAIAQSIIAPRQTARAVAEASSYMATRMDSEVAAMTDAIDQILLNPSIYEKAQNWTAKHAYFMQSAVDNFMGPIVWNGAYNQALEQGHSEKDAIRLADSAVRETQGSTMPEDVSRIETGNAFVRMFTQFAGYFNMQANLLGTEFAKTYHELGLRKGMGRGLYVFVLGFLIPNMMAELIAQAFKGGPDDEDKDGSTIDDWLMAVVLMGNVRAGLAMVPGLGQAANATINTFNKKPYDDRISTSPAVSMIESAVKAPVEVYKAATGQGSGRTAVRDLATLITMTTGLPATAVARPLGYITGVSENKIAPTGPVDTARGLVTGTPSPESKR